MTAFEIVADTALDEMQIEIVENDALPLVVDERNPYYFQVEYNPKEGIWYAEGKFQCREDPEQCVVIRRAYSNETVACISTFYDGLDDDGSNVLDDG